MLNGGHWQLRLTFLLQRSAVRKKTCVCLQSGAPLSCGRLPISSRQGFSADKLETGSMLPPAAAPVARIQNPQPVRSRKRPGTSGVNQRPAAVRRSWAIAEQQCQASPPCHPVLELLAQLCCCFAYPTNERGTCQKSEPDLEGGTN